MAPATHAPLRRLAPTAMKPPVRVAIVTSDGYEAWGLATEPVDAATNYALVDTFTQFLEKRLVTQNLALLRRMVAEYFCHCETTVREFIAQCSTQISVAPFEAPDPRDVAAAECLLRQPRSFARSGQSAAVFTFLVTRLCTARASLLMQFFVEFCQGEDTALRAFVATSEGVVAILPLAAPQVDHSSYMPLDGIPFESVEPQPMPPPPALGFAVRTPRSQSARSEKAQNIHPTGKTHKSAMKRRYDPSPDEAKAEAIDKLGGSDNDDDGVASEGDDEQSSSDSDQPDPTAFTTSFNHPDDAMNKVKTRLVVAVRKIEQHEPWKKVFTNDLPLPFDEGDAPDLARVLRGFWTRYGRVVWERNFWAPLTSSADPTELNHRRLRQRNAAIAFERLTAAFFERFGAKFFYQLDRKSHSGWWYRGFCVDLLSLSTVVGFEKCVAYVETQQHERFPDCGFALPLRTANVGVIQHQRESCVSKSLWLQTTKPEIEAIKSAFVAYLAKKNKKKRKKQAVKLAAKQDATAKKVSSGHATITATAFFDHDGPERKRMARAVEPSQATDDAQKVATAPPSYRAPPSTKEMLVDMLGSWMKMTASTKSKPHE